jgi:hypothetical protein
MPKAQASASVIICPAETRIGIIGTLRAKSRFLAL